MAAARRLTRAALVVLLAASAALWYACSDRTSESLTGPAPRTPPGAFLDLRSALLAQARHTDQLLAIPGVVGTAVTILPDGRPGVEIMLARPSVPGLPTLLDGIPVKTQVTGMLMAFSDPTKRQRPAPLGFSVGHPLITAGSIGARVADAAGNVFVLSNNHVLANSNDATIGDPALQPGPFDGGTAPADQIGTLAAFNTIDFSGGLNTIDAAIARSDATNLGNATPTDEIGAHV